MDSDLRVRMAQDKLLRNFQAFQEKTPQGLLRNLSEAEDFFNMGAYDLDKEQMLNPNSKLHNLFGGTATHSPKKKSNIEEEMTEQDHKLEDDDKFNFSESETEQQKDKPSDDFVPDERPFADMYAPTTTVDYLINKRKSP